MKTSKYAHTFRTALIAAALAAPCIVHSAQAEPGEAATADRVAAALKNTYPGTTFGAVSPTVWPGVFEVVVGSNLAYVDGSGQYFMFGHLYDMKAQRDLTAERKDSVTRIDFSALPLTDAITEVRGNGQRVLALFSDPDCPYCKKLENEIASLTNVTLHTFLMPIASLHPQAQAKAISVWCAPKRLDAWHALMRRAQPAPTKSCANPVERNIALAERLGISGTPTLIAADGRVLPGAGSLTQIEAWLNRSSSTTGGQ